MLTTNVFCLLFRTQRESPTNTTTNIPFSLYYKLQDNSLPSKWTNRGSEQKSYIPNFRFVSSGQQILAHFTNHTTSLRSYTSPLAQIAPTGAVTIDSEYAKLSSHNIKDMNIIISCIIWCLERHKRYCWRSTEKYEGWNFNSGNYLFTTDTK